MDGIAIFILVGTFFLLILLEYPISLSLGISSLLTIIWLRLPPEIMMQQMVSGLNNYVLLAIPLFLMAGEIMSACGIIDRIIDFAKAMVGHVKGGLGMINVFSSMLFGGISGSSIADTVCIGTTMIPAMTKNGYPAGFSTAVTVTGSVQGMLIPPSHHLILYTMIVSNVSIGQLYLAGIVPGILLGFFLMCWVYWRAIKENYPCCESMDFRTRKKVFLNSIPALMNIVIVAGSVTLGICTATESAALAVLYALCLSIAYRQMTFEKFKRILSNTLKTTASITSIIVMSCTFGWLLTYLKIPTWLSGLLIGYTSDANMLMMISIFILLILGTLVEPLPILFLVLPILSPLLSAAGVNMVHFGIVFTLAMGIAILNPPVGSTLFVGSVVGKVSLPQLIKEMMPFYVLLVIFLFFLAYSPWISMFLPNLLN